METSRILITEIAESDNNPRLITKDKMEALINSILSLPKMLDMRPIVIDGKAIIGGNMRHRALSIIAGMEAEEIAARLDSIGYIASIPRLRENTSHSIGQRGAQIPLCL